MRDQHSAVSACMVLVALLAAACPRAACPEGQNAVNGQCLAPCNSNTECRLNETCVDGNCQVGPGVSSSGGTSASSALSNPSSAAASGSSGASGNALSSDVTGPAHPVPSDNTQANVQVVVRDNQGSPAAGVVVTLHSDRTVDVVAPAQGLTDSTGTAWFTVASLHAGTAQISAAANGVALTRSATVHFTISPATSTLECDKLFTEADGVDSTGMTVTLRDGAGDAVVGTLARVGPRVAVSVAYLSERSNVDGTVQCSVRNSGMAGALPLTVNVDGVAVDGLCSTWVHLNQGLRAYYKLDGDALDASGNDSTLTPTGAPAAQYTPDGMGRAGRALFPGLAVTYTCATCIALNAANNPFLDYVQTGGAQDFTISVWLFRMASPGADGTWWGYGITDNGQVELGAVGGGSAPAPVRVTVRLKDVGQEVGSVQDPAFDFRSSVATNTWTHVVAFRRGSTLGLRVNNVETTAEVGVASVGPADNFRVAHNAGGYPWQGYVDEFGKWGRALSSDEMDALFNGGAGRTLPMP